MARKKSTWLFDLQLHGGANPEPFSPQGVFETLIIAKETNFGQKPTGMAGGIGQAFNSFPSGITIKTSARAPRGSAVKPLSSPGGRSLQSTLDVETTADTIAQILAYALGRQTITAASAMYSGALQAASNVGDLQIKLKQNTLFGPAMLVPGMELIVDQGGAHPETVTISSVNWSGTGVPGAGFILAGVYLTSGGPGTGLAFTHAANVTVIGAVTKAMNLISPVAPGTLCPTFTAQLNRPGSTAVNRLGCKIDQLSVSFKSNQGLAVKVAVCIQDEQPEGSPTPPTLSSKQPYVFEQLFIPPTLFGNALSNGLNSSLRTFDFTYANNLTKDNFVAGGGNLVYNWPEGQRSLTGTLGMGFETADEFDEFQTNSGGGPFQTGPFVLPLQALDNISGSGLPYFIFMYFPNMQITKWGASDETTKEITQTLTVEMGESTPGANDAIQVFAPQNGTSAF